MIIAETVTKVRAQVAEWRREGLTVGLVPTMGALHEGHVSLARQSSKECDRTVASIFVNPTQFAQGEDLDRYPRTFEKDVELLEANGCDMIFYPTVEEMYPEGFGAEIQVTTEMIHQLCGASRPGHFQGVCTVVGKLFNIVTPDKAFFGEKDAQQLAIIRKMVRDLNFPLEIVGCKTIREEDGLAMSSRNAYLSPEERTAARVLYRSMCAAADKIDEGVTDAAELKKLMTEMICAEPLAKIDYIEIVDGVDLTPVEQIRPGDLVALAVYIGSTRLIDNFTF